MRTMMRFALPGRATEGVGATISPGASRDGTRPGVHAPLGRRKDVLAGSQAGGRHAPYPRREEDAPRAPLAGCLPARAARQTTENYRRAEDEGEKTSYGARTPPHRARRRFINTLRL